MTTLKDQMLARIARTGPMTVAEYMLDCLAHPEHGYYATRDPFGQAGDFVTAPEVSQMFGELIGLCLAQTWIDQGRPAPFVLAELGPGRGTLMADLIRATASVPGFHAACALHLVETSPVLQSRQADALASFAPSFHASVDLLPDGPLFLIANEFFDALPIRQFQRGSNAWHERQIGADGDTLIWGLGPETAIGDLEARRANTKPGQIIETCRAAEAIAEHVGHRIARSGGAALFIDYGEWTSIGDTFQALRAHRSVDPLDAPGTADLTAHVAFGPLAQAAAPAVASGLTPQGVFLERLGITARAQRLAQGLSGPALDQHIAAHRRLTHPDAMGHLFKVLSLTPEGAPLPPALDTAPT